jgi:lysophospholipase L1-like esterase
MKYRPPLLSRRHALVRLLLALSLLGGATLRADPPAPKVTRVACIGDSIVYGSGVADREHNNWPAVLGRWLGAGWDVQNFGISGATMLKKGNVPYSDQKVYRQALEFKPDILIVSLGANDTKHPTDQDTNVVNNWQYKDDFVANYKDVIASFQAAGPSVKIYVCIPLPAYPGRWGINDTTIREEVTPLVREVARDTGATVIDLYTPLSDKSGLFPDTVHPNAAGARLVAATVFRALTDKAPPGGP